jgi:GrpB-like predicted nucleotidyltransferase (UPF0157 family)
VSNTDVFTLHPEPTAARLAAVELFARTREQPRLSLPASADIQHTGATAIAGCMTKGDLDIVVRVEPQHFAVADQILSKRYHRNIGSLRRIDFSAFEDTAASPPLGIQLTTIGGPLDVFHLFVDALTRSTELVAGYNDLKMRHNGGSMDIYRTAKNAFIAAVLAQQA